MLHYWLGTGLLTSILINIIKGEFAAKKDEFHSTTAKSNRIFRREDISFHAAKERSKSPSVILQSFSGHAAIFQKASIARFRMMYKDYFVILQPEAAEEFLSSDAGLEKAWMYSLLHPWMGTGLLTSNGSKWKCRRKLLGPSLSSDVLKNFVPIFDEKSKILVDVFKSRHNERWIDIRRPITLCSLDIMCGTLLGVNVGAQTGSNVEYVQALFRITQALMERIANPILFSEVIFGLTSLGRQFRKDIKCLHDFTRKVIQQKKATRNCQEQKANQNLDTGVRKHKALMDLLLDVHSNNKHFTEEDVREEIDTFSFAGHDTTSAGMTWALYLLGLYPEIQCKVHEELDTIFGDDRNRSVTEEDLREMHYLECVLKESQRIYPSVPLFARSIQKTFDLCGYKIRKGATVVICSYVLHRNPKVFPDPEKFDPARFLPENTVGRNPFAYVPFSAGRRKCLGPRFAMMEVKTVLANVLRNFQVKSLEHRDKICICSEITLRSAHPVKLTFTPREHVA